MVDIKKEAVNSVIWGTIDKFASQFISLFFSIILARILSPEDYGLIGILAIFTIIANLLQESGFTTALIKEKHISKIQYQTVFVINLLISLFLYFLLWINSSLIANYFGHIDLIPLSRFIFSSFVFNSLSIIPNVILTKELKFNSLARINLLSLVISGIIGVIFAIKDGNYWALAIQQVLYSIIRTILLWKTTNWNPFSIRIEFYSIRSIFKYSFKLLITGFINQISQNIYSILLGKNYPLQQVGFYTQGYNLYTKPAFILYGIINNISTPLMAKIQNNPIQLLNMLNKMIRYSALICFPIMFGFAFVAKELVIIIYTDKWLGCIPIIQLFCIWGAFLSINCLYNSFLIIKGDINISMYSHIIHAFLLILSLYLCVSKGIEFMIIINCILNYLMLIVWVLIVSHKYLYSFTDIFKSTFPYLCFTLISIVITNILTSNISNPYYSIIVKIAFTFIFYILLQRIFSKNRFFEDLQIIKSFYYKR